jgi:hypothetical protein
MDSFRAAWSTSDFGVSVAFAPVRETTALARRAPDGVSHVTARQSPPENVRRSAISSGAMRSDRALTLAFLTIAAAAGCRAQPPRAVIDGMSFALPAEFVRKAYERSRERVLDIPGAFTDQVFASWEGPGGQGFCVFYWSASPPRDLGPMVATRRWKARIAGRETDAAETTTFMGIEQRVFVAWLQGPEGAGRFMMYAKNMPREQFDAILATVSF